jgi:hypothetical protein
MLLSSPSIFETPLRGDLSQPGCKERRCEFLLFLSDLKLLYQAAVSTIQSHYNTMGNDGKEHSNGYENETDDDFSDMYADPPISGDIFGSQENKMEKLPLFQPLASCMCHFQFVFITF